MTKATKTEKEEGQKYSSTASSPSKGNMHINIKCHMKMETPKTRPTRPLATAILDAHAHICLPYYIASNFS